MAHITISSNIQHIIVMGVSGCGKTTLAQGLAAELGWRMLEGDALHPPTNVAKMVQGIPLTDDDRAPWLERLNAELRMQPKTVLACSALKARYRTVLCRGLSEVKANGKPVTPYFVHAHGSYDSLLQRMQDRLNSGNHFMPASLLQSQFEALELPLELGQHCITVSTEWDTSKQIAECLAAWH